MRIAVSGRAIGRVERDVDTQDVAKLSCDPLDAWLGRRIVAVVGQLDFWQPFWSAVGRLCQGLLGLLRIEGVLIAETEPGSPAGIQLRLGMQSPLRITSQ